MISRKTGQEEVRLWVMGEWGEERKRGRGEMQKEEKKVGGEENSKYGHCEWKKAGKQNKK